jgi:two-component system cell cycle sensor histidine kinase/response regulator CckA
MQQARFIADERRRTEELRRLTAAIKQTPDSIVITSCDGKVVYANPAFQTSSGYDVAEMMGRPLSALKSGQHDAAFYADLWSTISSGRTWTGRLINRRKNGELYTEEAVISPVRDDDGAIVNYVGIKRDITKELQQEAQNQQSQKMQAVGQLAGGIAHDFNNILQAILGFSELLMPTVEEHERAHVSEIRKAAKHAAELTKQLLAFSRKRPVESRIINLNSTIEETREILNSLIGENINVTTELDPQLSPVQADSSQLARILINLAVNGRDAMPRGGTIAIRTRNVTISPQQALGYPHGRAGTFACLSVADTGTGMPTEVKEHIFEPFFSTKGPGEGTGLGLASAYGIIQEHNGWIDVDSEEDNGSTFQIYLPVEASHPTITPQVPSAPAPLTHGNSETVLLVEDDPAIRLLVETALTSADFKVLVAADTSTARQLFEAHAGRVDLLISDIVLPDETGPELADALRAQKPELPVLLCSGYSRGHITQEEIQRKQYHFLEKPFTIAKLLDVVHTTLHDTPS